MDGVLALVRLTTYPLDHCPLWLMKVGDKRIRKPLQEIVKQSLSSGTLLESLKEAAV